MMQSSSKKLRLEIRDSLGWITLSRPEALNALDLEMVGALADALRLWRDESAVEAVILCGEGAKAFCAGGDVRQVIVSQRAGDAEYGRRFFETEYAADLALHRFPKPVIVAAQGFVLGGGLGLFASGRWRMLAPDAVLGMPEVGIGFFPDVGASGFLSRMPGFTGAFAAMTGLRLSAADAIWSGLAHVLAPTAEALRTRAVVFATEPPSLSEFGIARRWASEQSKLAPQREWIDGLFADGDGRSAYRRIVAEVANPDPWRAQAAQGLRAGSPFSALVAFELWSRGRGLTLEACFAQDLRLARVFQSHPDFDEGIRARLIDKDQNPHWRAKDENEVPDAEIQALFPG